MINLLSKKIELYLGRKPDFIDEVQVVDDGKGNLTIDVWNATDKEKPTEEQLDALESQAETLENNNQVIATRIKEYGSTAEQLEYIVENGVEAFVTKQQQIKISNPKE